MIGRIGPKIPQALLWIALGSLLGCGSGENSPSLSNTPPPPTADARADAEPVTPTDTDSPGPDDSKEPPSTDLPPNPPPTDTEEGSEDTVPSNDTNEPADTDSPDTQPFEPANLVPCNNDTDCENGWCVDTPTGAVCTPPCSPDCPDGWLCGLVSGEELCVPIHSHLCDPCTQNSDCTGWTDGAACVVQGLEGSFCGTNCDFGCPEGYTCEAVPDVEGTIAKHCIPAEGAECPCSPQAIQQALATECILSNDAGSCSGTRSCTSEGLSACEGTPPAPESCGGGDENCNGETDEPDAIGCLPWFVDVDEDGFGDEDQSLCLCEASGQHTALQAGDCEDELAAISPDSLETCNDIDDDCDGETDPENAALCTTYYFDGDGDDFGVQEKAKCLCAPDEGYSATNIGDCNDNNPNIFPSGDCAPASCNVFMLTKACDPTHCGAAPPPAPCPNGYICLNESSCREDCTQNSHCQPGLYCENNECVASKSDGDACNFDAECLSGYCTNGFCCSGGLCCAADENCHDNNPCTADQCGASFQCAYTELTGTSCAEAACEGESFTAEKFCEVGVCVGAEPIECTNDNPCLSSACDSSGCLEALVPAGVICSPATCIGFEITQQKTCDGQGGCTAGGEQFPCADSLMCAPDAASCLPSCATHADCAFDTYCKNGQCLPDLPPGTPCNAPEQCDTDKCESGFCCDGCCDYGTLGTDEFPRAMEICDETDYIVQGKSSCARVIDTFGSFSHADKSPDLDDTAMVQLSTGKASKISNQQNGENQETSGDDPDDTVSKVYDPCGFTLTLKAPYNATGFAFDFIFFSAEYPEWVGSQYNDSFNVMLDSLAYDNQNIAFDNNLNPISINVAFFTICDGPGCTQSGAILSGTGYNNGVGGSTGWLTTTVPIVPGETITLRFVIYDEGDHIFDSDVLINHFRWLEVVSGTGPVTE